MLPFQTGEEMAISSVRKGARTYQQNSIKHQEKAKGNPKGKPKKKPSSGIGGWIENIINLGKNFLHRRK